MAKDFYFKFYFKEWLVSTQGMEADIRGWYFNLLCHQADKHCLPSDLENLADLAGVKISQFERFKDCWKRTLKHKFKQNEDGTLYNHKMAEVIEDRKESSSKQSKRAVIGVFIKKRRAENDFTDDQWSTISAELMKVDFRGLSNDKKYKALSVRFNRIVEAVINNSNYNYNSISKDNLKGGVGEKQAEVDEFELTELKNQISNEVSWKDGLCRDHKVIDPSFTPEELENWIEIFFTTIKNDGEERKTVKDFKKHFNRWLSLQIKKNLSNEQQSNNQNQGASLEYRRKQAERLGAL